MLLISTTVFSFSNQPTNQLTGMEKTGLQETQNFFQKETFYVAFLSLPTAFLAAFSVL